MAQARFGDMAYVVYVGGQYDHDVTPQVLRKDKGGNSMKRKVDTPAKVRMIPVESVTIAGTQNPHGVEFKLGEVVAIPRLKPVKASPGKRAKQNGRCIVEKAERLEGFNVFDEKPEKIELVWDELPEDIESDMGSTTFVDSRFFTPEPMDMSISPEGAAMALVSAAATSTATAETPKRRGRPPKAAK